MDIGHTRASFNPMLIMRTWNSPCLKYTVITGLALAALALVVIGSIAYSGMPPLNILGDFCSLMMIAVGSKIILGGMVVLYFSLASIVSYQDVAKFNPVLKEREFFVFQNDTKQKMISLNDPDSGLQEIDYATHYTQLKKLYTEISVFELESREA